MYSSYMHAAVRPGPLSKKSKHNTMHSTLGELKHWANSTACLWCLVTDQRAFARGRAEAPFVKENIESFLSLYKITYYYSVADLLCHGFVFVTDVLSHVFAPNFTKNFEKWLIFEKSGLFFAKIHKFRFRNCFANFANLCNFSTNQLDSFLDSEKYCKLRIWLQNFGPIQPRTSLEKSDVSWPTIEINRTDLPPSGTQACLSKRQFSSNGSIGQSFAACNTNRTALLSGQSDPIVGHWPKVDCLCFDEFIVHI